MKKWQETAINEGIKLLFSWITGIFESSKKKELRGTLAYLEKASIVMLKRGDLENLKYYNERIKKTKRLLCKK